MLKFEVLDYRGPLQCLMDDIVIVCACIYAHVLIDVLVMEYTLACIAATLLGPQVTRTDMR